MYVKINKILKINQILKNLPEVQHFLIFVLYMYAKKFHHLPPQENFHGVVLQAYPTHASTRITCQQSCASVHPLIWLKAPRKGEHREEGTTIMSLLNTQWNNL